jgi:hypothetical protein
MARPYRWRVDFPRSNEAEESRCLAARLSRPSTNASQLKRLLIARPEPGPMNNQELQPKGEKAHRSGTASRDKSSPRLRSGGRLLKSLPWAWIALSGFATLRMVCCSRLGRRQAVSRGCRLAVQWKNRTILNRNSGFLGKPRARSVLAQPNIADDEILDGVARLQRSRQPARLFSAA